MAFIVKKFGGSSVATTAKIVGVAERVLKEKEPDDKIVLVVSAMGDTTDELISMAKAIDNRPSQREMDMLLSTGEQITISLLTMAFQKLGVDAVSLTGGQAGIATSGVHAKARIVDVNPERILAELDKDKIVVVAGFQGVTELGDITTLGRGGSDTTAVALAGALGADICEIFTDVDGVYSADPRVVKDARRMKEITYNEMLEMARLGAVVMQPRSVEMGKHYGVPIHVRSTFTLEQGTIIREEYTMKEREFTIRGVTHDVNVAKVAILGVPDQPGIAYTIFSALAEKAIDVDMIVQSIRNADKKIIDMVFTISKPDVDQAKVLVEKLVKDMGALGVVIDENVAKVSVVGAGMYGSPGIAATMFGALGEAGVNIEVISTSEISISCLIKEDQVKEAVNAIHQKFFKE
ncbi:aspartate kinase [Anaerosporomusa subterranea]|uniref:Aspartokinase n=1 Tax=Anaerosporomusa subterranea TaxID=1794912 RepID=A0A154BSH4_ANASB|nr:aspartate kinase [Anaerosporomusa subterranea]KYZ76916.1 aspartate kinase [Anaerosporomusa subterranea]